MNLFLTRIRPLACLTFLACGLAACGPNTDIPGHDGTTGITSPGASSSTLSGIIGSGTLGTSSTGGNSNNVVPSSDTGTVSVSGTISGTSFTAKDAVFGLGQTPGNLVVMTVVIGDQPNLCQFLAAQEGAANLVLAYIASTNPNTYPGANTYPVADPNGTLPDAVTTDSAVSQVAFAAIGATAGTFANAGQVQITTTAANTTQPESMTLQATDAAQDSVTGTLTPAYCNILSSGTSMLARHGPLSPELH